MQTSAPKTDQHNDRAMTSIIEATFLTFWNRHLDAS
jgi:hypothetical protein